MQEMSKMIRWQVDHFDGVSDKNILSDVDVSANATRKHSLWLSHDQNKEVVKLTTGGHNNVRKILVNYRDPMKTQERNQQIVFANWNAFLKLDQHWLLRVVKVDRDYKLKQPKFISYQWLVVLVLVLVIPHGVFIDLISFYMDMYMFRLNMVLCMFCRESQTMTYGRRQGRQRPVSTLSNTYGYATCDGWVKSWGSTNVGWSSNQLRFNILCGTQETGNLFMETTPHVDVDLQDLANQSYDSMTNFLEITWVIHTISLN